MKSIYTPKLITNVSAGMNPMDIMKMEYCDSKIRSAGHQDKNIVRHLTGYYTAVYAGK